MGSGVSAHLDQHNLELKAASDIRDLIVNELSHLPPNSVNRKHFTNQLRRAQAEVDVLVMKIQTRLRRKLGLDRNPDIQFTNRLISALIQSRSQMPVINDWLNEVRVALHKDESVHFIAPLKGMQRNLLDPLNRMQVLGTISERARIVRRCKPKRIIIKLTNSSYCPLIGAIICIL